jgi:hypothetical protein
MVFANSDRATTTVVRPTATGAQTLTVLNDQSAPRTFSWRVNVGEGRRLVTLGDGSVAVVNPHPEPVGDPQMAQDSEIALVNTGLDQLEPNTPVPAGAQALAGAVGDTPAELVGAHDVFARAQNSTLDEVVLVFPRPWALDAAGRPVPASLSTDGDTVALTVDPASDAAFPVIADPAPTASAARRGAPLRLMTFNTRSGRPTGTGDPANGDPALHTAHARRVAAVIYHQMSSRALGHRVPGIVGLQEMCQYDLKEIVRTLNERDQGTNTLWRSEFHGLAETDSCPNQPGRDYGNAIVRNVIRNAGDARRFAGQDPTRNAETGKLGERRGYIRLQIDVRGRPVEFLTTHLIPRNVIRDGADITVKQEQSRQLLNRARGFSSPTAAGGDFNAFPASDVIRDWIDARFLDVDSCRRRPRNSPCNETTYTNEDDERSKIDYIFTRGMGINGADVKNVTDQTSDHDTLVASTEVP